MTEKRIGAKNISRCHCPDTTQTSLVAYYYTFFIHANSKVNRLISLLPIFQATVLWVPAGLKSSLEIEIDFSLFSLTPTLFRNFRNILY